MFQHSQTQKNESILRISLSFTDFEFKGISYKFVTEEKTWDESESNCVQQGGHLVTITSSALNKVLQDKLEDM